VSASQSGASPKSDQLVLVTHSILQKFSSKFVQNFLSHPADRQMDR